MSRMTKPLMTAIAVLLSAALFTCAGGASASQSSTPTPTTSSAAPSAPAAPIAPAAQPKPYTGDGGSGIRLAVLVPSASNLPADQNYLPSVVQGELVANLSGYSAMSVLDRMRLETVLRETESGIYQNEADFGRLGEIANVDYVLTGSVTRTSTGHTLQLQIVGTGGNNIGIAKASYSGTTTVAEMDNFTGIRRASLELLTQMGVTLTNAARTELSGAASAARVNAQTAVARGIVSQRQGNTAETMAHFYEAATADPSLAEAVTRANTMSTTIRTGNLRENVLNDIAWRDEWVKILADAEKYLRSQPINVARIEYNPNFRQGETDYTRRTVELIYSLRIMPLPYPQVYIKMIADLNTGLNNTGRQGTWGLKELEPRYVWGVYDRRVDFTFDVIDSNGNVLKTQVGALRVRGTTSELNKYSSIYRSVGEERRNRSLIERENRNFISFLFFSDVYNHAYSNLYEYDYYENGYYQTSERLNIEGDSVILPISLSIGVNSITDSISIRVTGEIRSGNTNRGIHNLQVEVRSNPNFNIAQRYRY